MTKRAETGPMKGKSKRNTRKTQTMLEAATGGAYTRVHDFDRVLAALQAGVRSVAVDVRWYPDGGFHQLILVKAEGDRLYFINPAGHVEGPLKRRVEPDGTESCLAADLRGLFDSGKGEALFRA